MPSTCELSLDPFDNKRLLSLCGQLDEHLRQLEKRLNVEISNRGNSFQITGDDQAITLTKKIIENLYHQTSQGEELTPTHVHLCLQEHKIKKSKVQQHKPIKIVTPKKTIQALSENQRCYLKKILGHDINFGIGPAGTGKTYLAVACAVAALEEGTVSKILLVRPAVEAGERLGFLPGDLKEKVNPYLRPIFDALYEMMGTERANKLMEQEVIEVAPLAYMRGRTLNDAFIILDEGQNVTCKQMKMFLTRIGFSSTVVITGDVTQVDLPQGERSGLAEVFQILRPVREISFTQFSSEDVARHPLVQKILDAYDRHEKN